MFLLGRGAKSELQSRIEKGEHSQDVVMMTVALLNVDFAKVVNFQTLRATFEENLKLAISSAAEHGIRKEHVLLALPGDGSGKVQCMINPPPGVQATEIDKHLRTSASEIADALLMQIKELDGIRHVHSQDVQVTDVSEPSRVTMYYPELRLGKRHRIPNGVFSLFENVGALDDSRTFAKEAAQGAGEIEWAFQKCAELFKDQKLERLFVSLVTQLQLRSRQSCNEWATYVTPNDLQFICSENPVVAELLENSAGFPRDQLLQYAARCRACVAIGIMAGDIMQLWTTECTAEDRAFLHEVLEKVCIVSGPDFSVTKARALWVRASCRYLAIDHLLRMPKNSDDKEKEDGALACLRKCPRDILCAQFRAPWRGPNFEESFFHLYQTFAAFRDIGAAEELSECLAQAHTHPTSHLHSVIHNYLSDPSVPNARKTDLVVSFLSSCRQLRTAASSKNSGRSRGRLHSSKEKSTGAAAPRTAGLEMFLLDTVVREHRERTAALSRGEEGALDEDLAQMFEAALLLSSGDNLRSWASHKVQAEPRLAKDAKRLLSMVGARHVSELLREVVGGDKAYQYNNTNAAQLIESEEAWTHDSRRAGFFSSRRRDVPRAAEDYGHLLHMYLKLDLALEGDSAWHFMQALEPPEAGTTAGCFAKLAPKGSALRLAIAVDVQHSLGERVLEASEIDVLLSYSNFFSPAFQRFLRTENAVAQAREVFSGVSTAELPKGQGLLGLLEATLKLVNANNPREFFSDGPIADVLADICERGRNEQLVWRLFGKVIQAVKSPKFSPEDGQFGLAQFQECAKEITKAARILHFKMEGGATDALLSDVERVVLSFLSQGAPRSWITSLRSLDTVIFTLEFMGKEDLKLAFERFETELKSEAHGSQLHELLQCAKAVYSKPLASAKGGMSPDSDIKATITNKAPKLQKPVQWKGISFLPPDWQLVVEIAAAAADAMQRKYNLMMLPHHTQMIAVLMFGIRACAVAMPKERRPADLPHTMLARVGTGEGKSLIIGMLASFVAKKGLRAHVVNNNRVLTRRDFATNDKFFRALGIKASLDPKDLKNEDCKIVYCTSDDVESTCLDSLIEGEFEEHEKSLEDAVLIVDEVDGLIFDKGATSAKLFSDRDLGDSVNDWLEQLRNTGKIERDWEDFRAGDEVSQLLQKEVEEAYVEAANKEEGRDYTVRGEGSMYMVDSRTGLIKESGWSLWLEILKSSESIPAGYVDYKYEKAILSRLQCFMSYSCICGLTGSLGREAEKSYLLKYYEAVTFNVPFFLDTCRGGPKNTVYGKKVPVQIGNLEPFANRKAQEKAVVALAASKCREVPVLVVTRDTESVHRLVSQIRQHFRDMQPEDDATTTGHQPDSARSLKSSGWNGPVIAPRPPAQTSVITLLHNPKKPNQFVELVEKATEPLDDGSCAGFEEGKHQKWHITVTTAEGGRGHDYRVTDPGIDQKGGLLLILTWVPQSEREWIQLVGRTGRQDHTGQYAVLLNAEDEDVQAGQAIRDAGESIVSALLKYGDQETNKMLQGTTEDIARGRMMHKLTSKYWALHKQDQTNRKQNWEWKGLCKDYVNYNPDQLEDKFCAAFPPTADGGAILKKDDGRRYEGGMKDGKPHGYGKFMMPDGTVFEGQWQTGKMHGQGKYIDAKGARYEGGWENHKKSGKGVEVYADGTRYEGEFLQGCKHGFGKYTSAGGASYEGQFKKDKMDGHGERVFSSGHKYSGQWQRGQMSGTGTMVWADGVTYEGRFESDVRHGRGMVKWPDGRTFRGHWQQGRMNGPGTMTDANGATVQCSNPGDVGGNGEPNNSPAKPVKGPKKSVRMAGTVEVVTIGEDGKPVSVASTRQLLPTHSTHVTAAR